MGKKLFKWQQKIVDRVKEYTNDELLDETFLAAGGDDWDGHFTDRGLWEYRFMTGELRKRLRDVGWLEKPTEK